MIQDLQKASILKRMAAGLLDLILLSIVAVGCIYLLTVITGYNKFYEEYTAIYQRYEEQYDIEFAITQEEYTALPSEQRDAYDSAIEALGKDNDALYNYNMIINLTLLNLSIGIFLGCLLLEFVLPLIFKNGQTVGKKIFAIGVMRTDSVKVTPMMMFVRALLGKYTIEIMVPALLIILIYFNVLGIIGLVVIGLIGLLQIILLIATRTNSFIHDVIASTVTVDISSQKIFDTPQALLDFTKEQAAEKAAKQTY